LGETPPTPLEDGVPTPQRHWAVLAIALAIAMSVLDGSIANVALPTIAHALQARPASAIWMINAYQLTIVASLLPMASLGEIFGYARIYRVGLAVFVLASALCAASGTLALLVAARVLQGLGAAGVMSVNGALIRFIYPRALLGRGIGLNAMVVALSSVAGPTLAAGILSVASWQWLFAVNVPTGLVALAIALRGLPATPTVSRPFDVVSTALNAITLGLLIVVISEAGLGLPIVLGLLGIMLASGALLVRRQLGQAAPLLPLDLLRIPAFALSVLASILTFSAQMLAFVSLPFYVQDSLGWSSVETGLLMTPWPLALVVVAPLAGRLSDRISAGVLGTTGLLLLAAGLLLIALAPAQSSARLFPWLLALCGVGFGLFQAPNNRIMLQAAPRHRAGGASGMQATARLLGQSCGAAFVALILAIEDNHGSLIPVMVAAGLATLAAVATVVRSAAMRGGGGSGG
jgi:DHA2 family multidrug resistance protein-like MFS transporter